MSTAADLIQELLARGVEVWIESGKLKVRAEEGVLTPEMLGTLRAQKEELLRLLPEYRISAPLSADQEGLWFIQQSAPDNTAYNVPVYLRIESEDDHRPALRRALQRLVDRHSLLRTTYAVRDGHPLQIVHAHRAIDHILVEVDAEHLSLAEVLRDAAVVQQRPFDLAEAAFRACLFRRGPGESVLLLCVHHIAIDGWSTYLLLDELVRLYEADGRANPLSPIKRSYQQFVTWQRDMLARSDDELRRAWLNELADAPSVLRLPTDRPRPPIQTFRGATRRRPLAPALVHGLRALAQRQRTTLPTILLTAFQLLLHRYSGQEDLCVGYGVSRRDREEFAGTFGYMVNQLVVRSRLAAEEATEFRSLIQQTQERLLSAISLQDYPFRWLVRDLLTDRDPSRPPLVQAAFVYQRTQSLSDAAVALLGATTVQVRDARWTALPPSRDTSELDLILEVREWTAELELGLRYNTDLFDAVTIDRMAGHLESLLRAAVADPGRAAMQLPMLSDAERHQLVVEWNRTEAPFSSEACIHELFEAHVDRAPDAPALVDLCDLSAGPGGATISYRELDRRANRIAHRLISLGVGPEVRVGVCLPRGAELVTAVLGVLKAGGACVVLDPEHPPQRLALLLEDVDASMVLVRSSRAGLPETAARVVELDRDLDGEPAGRLARRATASNLAYVLFTSGSTGRPNGVLIEHRGLVNSIEAHIRVMETGPATRQVHVLSFNFDAAFAHLFDTICAGGALYLVPRDGELLGTNLVALMAREAITHVSLVPSMLAVLPDAELPALRTIVVGGEPCSAELVARWGAKRRFLNLYGPTEATILATAAHCAPDGSRPPIGRPIANLHAYVVERSGQLAPLGVTGELWLGGVGVARGYLNRPELTAQKFIESPFGEGRLYRTGDLVRLRAVEGGPPVLEFVGRADHQVKIRGHRIELGEVESALRASPEVRDAAAVVHAPDGAPARLVAYVTPARAAAPESWELEQVDAWSAVLGGLEQADATDDLSGWKSSYTGQDLPREEMLGWVESTVGRILELAPREVLEIGCGSGMLLTRIAPRVRRYRGTDLSRHAIERVEALKARLDGLGNVAVSQQPAHDLTGLAGERFDTVILNSVVQYFPSAGYLLRVLEGLLGLLAPGGAIFLGDLRNLALLETYHASVERARGGCRTRQELRHRVQRAMIDENELVVHPRFFTALRDRFPQITGVEISPKRGAYRNELSLFRYDVTIHTSAPAPGASTPPIEWREAGAGGPTLEELRAWIERAGPGRVLGLRGIPNARLVEDNAWRRWLTVGGESEHLPWRPPPVDPRALDPEALYALPAELPCRVRLSWAAGHPDGCLDVIVTTGDLPPPRSIPDVNGETPPRDRFANDPLQGRRYRELAAALDRELREKLPSHLVPSSIVVLPALPLTLSGKVDLRALPPPDAFSGTRAEPAEPRTEAERALAAIWCSVLGLPRVGVHDNFFALGGDSIVSIRIISMARARGLSLRAVQLFEHPTIAELAAATEREVAREQEEVSGPVPLTPIQRWFFAQELPAPGHFNQGFFLESPADLDPEILRRALRHLQVHHDALRTRFTRRGEGWIQDCLATESEAALEVALEVVDLSSLSADGQRAAMAQTAERLEAGLDLTAGPIMRAAVFRIGADRPGRLLWIIHHLVVDIVSWGVLIADLSAAYRYLAAGSPVTLPAKTTSFQRWARRLSEHARGAAFEQERSICALDPPAPLPVDRPGGRNLRASAAVVRVSLSPEETHRLTRDALPAYRLGVQDLLLTALARTVARWSGCSDVWLDLEGHGREEIFDDVDLSRTVGWFTSLFPARLSVPGDDPREALVAVKEQLRAIPGRGLGYGLLRYLHEDGARLRWPAPEISFNYFGQLRFEADAPGALRLTSDDAGPLWAPEGARPHALAVNAAVAGDRLEVSFEYSRDLHAPATVERLAGDFLGAVGRLVQHCLSPGVGEWTPSDFPLVGLGRADLRGLLEQLGEPRRSKIEAIYPLTPLQEGLLFHTLRAETEAAYAIQLAFTLDGPLDVPRLRAAWEHAIRRHPMLRSCFLWSGLRAPVQVVLRDAALPWFEHDRRDAPDLDGWVTDLGHELAARPIALDAAPLLRLTLVRTGEQRHVLFWDTHHVLMDGWSMPVVLGDVLEAYRSQARSDAPIARAAGSYESYLRFLERQDRARSEAFWRRALHGFDAPTPLVMERTVPSEHRGHRQHEIRLDATFAARLAAVAEAHRVTLATVIEGAWALYLSRISSQEDVLFGTVVSGRDVPVDGIEDMVGLFVRTLPIRVRVDEAGEVWPWLQALQEQSAARREHQHTPLVVLQQLAGIPAGTDLFRSVVVFENYPFDTGILESSDLTLTYRSNFNPTHYPLTVVVAAQGELQLSFEYDTACFDPRSIEQMALHVEQLLRSMLATPSPRLADLSLLTAAEHEQVVTAWNQTALAYDRGPSIHALFEAQVVRTPDAPAVYFQDRVISYAELDRRANRLARHLQRRGVAAETRVGICVGRSDDMIVSLFAVLKAGGAYVPLDPAYPPARLAVMAEDAGISMIVTHGELCAWLADPRVGRVELDRGAAAIAAEADGPLSGEVPPDRLAYIIYTSGSTGRPKGVAIEHRHTIAMLHSSLALFAAEDLQGVSACTSICFDVSAIEIFVPLIAGGAIIVAADLFDLPHVPARDRVRMLHAVPSAMSVLLAASSLPAGIRVVALAGEKLGNELVQRLYQVPGIACVYNLYGPTETNYATSSATLRATTVEPTIGRPIANTQIFVLDRRLRPVPVGVPGEIYIGGDAVARGYWNRPALTAERFLPNPFGPGRLYRTGDLGRFRLDGEIEFLGRIDHQVKLRGFRIELGEVEATLERIAGVAQAVAIVHGTPPHQRLVAYWSAEPGRGIEAEALRAELARTLPEFMVPDVYVRLDAFPLTASGKVDRRALRPPEDTDLRRGEYVAPETETEHALAAIWREVLGVARVGAHDNFFALGGHSLLALTMVTRVKLELGRTVAIAALFEAPTLRELARRLDGPSRSLAEVHPLLVPFQTKGPRTPVFCVSGFGVHGSYFYDLASALGADQPFYGLTFLDPGAEMQDASRLEELAEAFADIVQGIQPGGPYILSGHSAGARLALAIAFVLESRGHRTALAVLDTDAPLAGQRDRWKVDVSLMGYVQYVWVLQDVWGDRAKRSDLFTQDLSTITQLPEDDPRTWQRIAEALQEEQLLPPGNGVEILQRMIRLRQRVFQMLEAYIPEERYQGPVMLLIVASSNNPDKARRWTEGWQKICVPPVQTFLVPGGHVDMIHEPHVGSIAAHLRRLVDEHAPGSPGTSFPVSWDTPEEARSAWLLDAAHSAAPMSPLDFDLRIRPMTIATNRASERYRVPLQTEPRLVNAFVYQRVIEPGVPPEALTALLAESDVEVRRVARELSIRWETLWLPAIQAQLAELSALAPRGAALPLLLEHLADAGSRTLRLWELHFELLSPVLVALSDFEDAYRDLFPGAVALDAHELLAGFPNKTVEANLEIWELGRQAARTPALAALVRERDPSELPAALAETPEGRALWRQIGDHVARYGERNDDLYLDTPTWIEDPTPVLRGLRAAALQPERDLAAELRRQAQRREARLAEVRARLASHPRPVVEELESLLGAAQVSTVLSEDHNFWLDTKITYHLRRVSLEIGRRLAERGAIDQPDDVFWLTLAELTAEAGAEAAAPPVRERIVERRAHAARFAGMTPPPVLGEVRPLVPTDCAILRASSRFNGDLMRAPRLPGELAGMPGSRGKVTGPARIVRSLAEAAKLAPGDVLVAPATLPSWTPLFAIAAAVVTDVGGILCHAAVVAREYGIPAVVGASGATAVLRDGQLVAVDGDAGVVRGVE